MEQEEVEEEVRGHTISGTEGYAKDFICILRSTGGQRKHFDKEEQEWRVGGRHDKTGFLKKLVVYGKQNVKGLEKMWEDQLGDLVKLRLFLNKALTVAMR